MNVVSVALAANYSAVLSLQGLNTNGPIGLSLTDDQTTADTFILYGTLDAAAVDNTNAQDLGRFAGGGPTNFPRGLSDVAKTWPFLLVRRTAGATAGSFLAVGDASAAPAVVSTAAPVVAAGYSAAMTLTSLSAQYVRIGGSTAMTATDIFDVFLTNDSTVASSVGCFYAGRITGGGGTNSISVLFSGYAFAIVQRVSGSTAGTIIAASVAPDSGGGSLNLTTLAVGDTAVSGPIGALTAAQTVDIYSSFRLTQTTASVVATLPNPTVTTAGKVALVMNNDTSTQPIVMYGMTIGVGAVQLFEWDGTAWLGGRNITQGGNAFGAAMTIGTIDAQTLNIDSAGAAINLGTNAVAKTITIGNGTGVTAISVFSGTGIAQFGANATDHATTLGSLIGVSAGTLQGGTSGVLVQTGAGGPISFLPGAAGATFLLPTGAGAGATGPLAFRELAANGTNFVALKAPDLVAANTTYTLPNAFPVVDGQQLESTIAGVMSWGGVINVVATNTNAQTIADGAAAAIVTTWTEALDTAAAFDAAAGTFTVPAGGAGLYEISASLQYAATAAAIGVTFDVNIALGGVIQRTGQFVNPVAALTQTRNILVTAMLQLAVGNVITISTALSANGGTDIALTNSALFNFLSIARVSA